MQEAWESVKGELASANWGYRIENEDRLVEVYGYSDPTQLPRRQFRLYSYGYFVGVAHNVDNAVRYLQDGFIERGENDGE